MKKLLILGSTGSIGRQALSVAENLQDSVVGLTAGTNAERMLEQIARFHPSFVAMQNAEAAERVRREVGSSVRVFVGDSGITDLIQSVDFDLAVNGIVGMAGTKPFLEVLKRGKILADANKESLVTAGPILKKYANLYGGKYLPVDSEHSAVFSCLQAAPPEKRIRRILLTASGGPFFGWNYDRLKTVTPEMALKHPSWKMGPKITVDCATMMNKGLEVMEAVRLFDVSEDQVDIVVHRESIVHSMVEFSDCSTIAQLSRPDMRIAIQYAISYPDRVPSPVEPLDWTQMGSLSFAALDTETFPATELCREVIRKDGIYPTVLNAANEIAVHAFLENRIGFTDIVPSVRKALDETTQIDRPDLDTIFRVDGLVRKKMTEVLF